jgi:transmembrane sensor
VVRRGADTAADVGLTPGRELVASLDTSSTATVLAADPAKSLAWETGQLSFDDEPLGLAIEQVNRYSKNKLVIADRRIADMRISGLFTAGDTQAFLDGVSSLSPIVATRHGSDIILRHE